MINILHVIPYLGLGGAERQLVELVKNINREIYNPIVCCLGRKGKLATEVEGKGFKVFPLNKRRKIDALRVILNIIKLIKRYDIDIVHTWMYSGGLYGRIAARIASVPIIIYTERGQYHWKKWYHIKLDNCLDGFTNKLVANADAVSKFYIEQHKTNVEKWITVYNGVDTNRFIRDDSTMVSRKVKNSLNIPFSSSVVGMIGNLAQSKDHVCFIKAAPQILKSAPNTYFIIVGGSPQSVSKHMPYKSLSELKCLSESFGCSERFVFTGFRDNVPEILNCFDISVLPSTRTTREGCPNVILESMAAQKPIVAARVSGIPEIIFDGVNGFLVPPENSQELAEKVLILLNNKELSEKMGKAGRSLVEDRHTVSRMVKETESLYCALLKDKSNK